jgi:acetylornithine deacetylase/succinyl-diaminopimelate desuccinylase-like protein
MATGVGSRIGIALLGISALAILTAAQRPKSTPSGPAVSRTASEIRIWREANETRVMDELRALLEIPNFASDTDNIRRNAEKLKDMLETRGFETRLRDIDQRGPVVFGELKTPGAKRTIIFYMHYDGQSVDPKTWTGTKPYEPALRDKPLESEGQIISFPYGQDRYQDDWRLYARSAADDKSPIVALLAAMDALRARQIPLGVNVKVVFEGEEEAGSPHLEHVIESNHSLLEGDLLINGDGPVHQSGRMQVLFGNRGIVTAQITVYGPLHSLHSGHYGNWAPNPAMRLAQLLASMKTDDGRVRIANFYDGVEPLGETAEEALKEMPNNDEDLKRDLGINSPDGDGKKLVELITQPSLNIDGLRSEDVGEQSRTIIPERAVAAVDMRLVKNIAPEVQFARLVKHIRAQGYYVVTEEPSVENRRTHAKIARVVMSNGGYPASFTSMDLPVSKALVSVVNAAVGGDLIRMPISGGSSPMYIFENLRLPVINVPIVNYDDNQHSPNENLRIGNLWRGMEIYGALLADLKW